jgi:hypothetical protein
LWHIRTNPEVDPFSNGLEKLKAAAAAAIVFFLFFFFGSSSCRRGAAARQPFIGDRR